MKCGDINYIKQFTKEWELIDKEDFLELWEYFDSLEWELKYAIKVYNEVRITMNKNKNNNNPHDIFEIALKLYGFKTDTNIDY